MKYVVLVLIAVCFQKEFYALTSRGVISQGKSHLQDNFWNFNAPLVGNSKIRWKVADVSEKNRLGNIICIHGFGGNADQFRKNIPHLAENGYRSFSIDLLGYGYSDKPNPRSYEVNSLYNFENWAEQITEFVKDVVKEPTYLICNSVGGLVGLQASLKEPKLIKGIVLINMSLRKLHKEKQIPFARPFISSFQVKLFFD
jgi:pimeloyl-ACP methyl ester carboxylesterase